jgi:hypothetical protein
VAEVLGGEELAGPLVRFVEFGDHPLSICLNGDAVCRIYHFLRGSALIHRHSSLRGHSSSLPSISMRILWILAMNLSSRFL